MSKKYFQLKGLVALRHFLILGLLFLCSFQIKAQEFVWAIPFSWASNDQSEGKAIVVDSVGNSYVTGRMFQSKYYVLPGPTAFTVGGNSDGFFVAKFSSTGDVLWFKTQVIGSGGVGRGICLDKKGNIYATGSFTGSIGFYDSGNNIKKVTGTTEDIFVARFDNNGNAEWIISENLDAGDDWGTAITINKQTDSLYVTGFLGSTVVPSIGNKKMFLAQYQCSNGARNYLNILGGTGHDEGAAITFNTATSKLFLTGNFKTTTGQTSNFGSTNLTSQNESVDAFIACANTAGVWQWATSGGGELDDNATGISHDANGGIYAAGELQDTINAKFFKVGGGNLPVTGFFKNNTGTYVVKYNAAGTAIRWAHSFSKKTSTTLKGIKTTSSGESSIIGRKGSYSFGIHLIYISTIDSSGNTICELEGAESTENLGRGQAIDIDQLGFLYSTGALKNAGPSKFPPKIYENSAYGLFVAKATPCNPSCSFAYHDQNPIIESTSPKFNRCVTPADTLKYDIDSVPALISPRTSYIIRIQIAPEIISSTGIFTGDWANGVTIDTTITTLSVGSYIKKLAAYLTATNISKNYFWRVGIIREDSSLGHQPVIWSAAQHFVLKPASLTIPFDTTGHTNDINWVYGVSYLDNGTTSEGIAYIDGLGKSRQVQSKLNSENKIMAVEAAYSEEGGGSVMTLPAPLASATFGYAHRFFDVYDGGWRDFGTQDFDREIKSSVCRDLMAPTPVDTTTAGSVGHYYSFNNTDAYVDASQGYPYAYNVGYKSPLQRPMLTAGGVGSTFKITGGKEYKHFYGKPTQHELDRVFGRTAAPECAKINRNITYDPNGVGYITYKDNEGKVIATAITSCSTPSLDSLNEDGKTAFAVNVNPLSGDLADKNGDNLATSKFFVPCTGLPVVIKYTALLNSFTVEGLPCQTCKYDVDVNIVQEDCSKKILSKSKVIVPSVSLCGDSTRVTVLDTTLYLDGPATYLVTRKLKPHTTNQSGTNNALGDLISSITDSLRSKRDSMEGVYNSLYNADSSYFVLRKTITSLYGDETVPDLRKYRVGTFAGSGDTCNPLYFKLQAGFDHPRGITRDELGNYYVADAGNNRIIKIEKTGASYILAGDTCGTSGTTDSIGYFARFNNPYDVVYYRSVIHTTAGDIGVGYLFVADRNNNIVRRVETATGRVKTFGSTSLFTTPEGLGIDKNGTVYVASTGNNKIYKIDLSGTTTTHIAGTGSSGSTNGSATSTATFNQPADVAADKFGSLYIADKGNHLIRKLSSTTVSTYAGTNGVADTTEGNGTAAKFNTPVSVGVDAQGNVFVSDYGSHRIRRIDAATVYVQNVAGVGTTSGYVDGLTYVSKLKNPSGLYVPLDYVQGQPVSGMIQIADAGNNRIRTMDKITCYDDPATCSLSKPDTSYVWYADAINILDINDGTHTKHLVDLDADADNDGTPGDENYKAAAVSFVTNITSGTVYNDFIAAYKRQYNADLSVGGKLLKLEQWQVTYPSLSTTVMQVFDDERKFVASDFKTYYLLRARIKRSSCDEYCDTDTLTPPCSTQCERQRLSLNALALEAYGELDSSKYTYDYQSNSYSLRGLVDVCYPLTQTVFNQLKPADQKLYKNYHRTRMASESFSVSDCETLCNGTPPTACEICQTGFISCRQGYVNQLTTGFNYLLNKWPATASFPYDSLGVLMPIADTLGNRAPEPNEYGHLGEILFNYLVDHIATSGAGTIKDRSVWEALGGNCPNCATDTTLAPFVCAAGNNLNLNALPTRIIPLLDSVMVRCQNEYKDCLYMNGTATQQNDRLCLQQKRLCLASARNHADTLLCNASYTTCVTNHPDSVTTVDRIRIEEIHRFLVNLYPLPSDSSIIDSITTVILTATSSLNIMQFELYLSRYEYKLKCSLECRRDRTNNFNDWFDHYLTALEDTIRNRWQRVCTAKLHENFNIKYNQSFYHYTLYYYDKANNLTATVPPEGIDYIEVGSGDTMRVPVHRLKSTYTSTSLYTLKAESPDEGATRYLYDKAGRIRFSQTAEQRARSVKDYTVAWRIFSYVKYDNDMRVTETGEYRDSAGTFCYWSDALAECPYPGCLCAGGGVQTSVAALVDDANFPFTPANTFEETYIAYDIPLAPSPYQTGVGGAYLQGRVSKTWNSESSSFFEYDAHGRVSRVIQQINAMATGAPTSNFELKTVNYSYQDLTSRIDQVIYQKGNVQEEFRQRYTYDSDYRLTKTEVSRDTGRHWLASAQYSYYIHGPLKHTALGNKVQDIDFTYNINGWLKAINSPIAKSSGKYSNDIGESDSTGHFAKDVFAEAINYYSGDYKRSNTGFTQTDLAHPQSGRHLFDKAKDLFNGNIASVVTRTGFDMAGLTKDNIMAQAYSYDLLNRLTSMYVETQAEGFTTWKASGAGNNAYSVRIKYDANGNIDSLRRYTGTAGTKLDDLAYKYGKPKIDYYGHLKKQTNKLVHVRDTVGAATVGDIGDNGSGYVDSVTTKQNYQYDAKGRMLRDSTSGIDSIKYTVYDKVKTIYKHNGTVISFTYDSKQQRLTKKVDPTGSNNDETTFYIYDASGILLSTYTYKYNSGYKYYLNDDQVYGLNHTGTYKIDEQLVSSPSAPANDSTKQRFFVTDHLGSVRAIVAGNKLTGNAPNVMSLTDYTDFGSVMNGRSFVGESGRFGYQGSERDKEVDNSSTGSFYTTEYRMLDVRLGRWFSPDPIVNPSMSPYVSMNNNPINLTDVLGLTPGGKSVDACASFDGGDVAAPSGGGSAFDFINLAGSATTSAIGPEGECYSCMGTKKKRSDEIIVNLPELPIIADRKKTNSVIDKIYNFLNNLIPNIVVIQPAGEGDFANESQYRKKYNPNSLWGKKYFVWDLKWIGPILGINKWSKLFFGRGTEDRSSERQPSKKETKPVEGPSAEYELDPDGPVLKVTDDQTNKVKIENKKDDLCGPKSQLIYKSPELKKGAVEIYRMSGDDEDLYEIWEYGAYDEGKWGLRASYVPSSKVSNYIK